MEEKGLATLSRLIHSRRHTQLLCAMLLLTASSVSAQPGFFEDTVFTGMDSVAFDKFVRAVALDDGVAMVSNDASSDEGAYIFSEQADGTWMQQAPFFSPIPQAGDISYSVALDGPTAALGDPFFGGGVSCDGDGLIDLLSEIAGVWSITGALTGPSLPPGVPCCGTDSIGYGRSIAIAGERMVIGADGKSASLGASTQGIAVFLELIGTTWSIAESLTGSETLLDDRFG